jgi:hypothetical protein
VFGANYNLTWDGDGRTTVDGDTYCSGTCQAGDTITLPSGTTNDQLYIVDLHGSSGNPIIIRNTSGAQTIIDTNDETGDPVYSNGIWVQTSDYVKIDGSHGYTTSNLDLENPGSYTFGIRVTDCAGRGVALNEKAHRIEIAYLEIDNIGDGALGELGIGIQDYNSITNTNVAVDDIIYDIVIHHNYIHDVTTEGMYIANTGACTTWDCCDSQDDSDDAVEHDGTEIYYNRTDNTGWDGIQVGCDDGAVVYNNIVTDAGLDDFGSPGQGACYSLNRGFGGDFYNNRAIRCQKQGVLYMGVGAVDVYNNLFADVGLMVDNTEAHSFQDVGAIDSGAITFRYNTIISPDRNGIDVSGSQTGTATDNLWVDMGESNDYGSMTYTNHGIEKTTVAECNFEDEVNDNYDLTSSTPSDILDSGQTVGYPSTDIEGNSRNSPPDIGAYEHAGSDSQGAEITGFESMGFTF